jgi:hypothetical protein
MLQSKTIIPLNIFQTWKTLNLPENMKKNVEILQTKNPEFKYYLYDDDMCREFIKNNFHKDILYTFDKLKHGVYKADLWRYCILYIYGGIYLDIKYSCINNSKLIYLTNKEYYAKDILYERITGIYNGILICMPQNEILFKSIELIVENVKNNNYEYSEKYVTGSHMLSSFFNEIQIKQLNLSLSTCCTHILFNNSPIFKIYDEYRNEQNQSFANDTSIILIKYYKLYWLEKNVYNYPTLKSLKHYNYTKKISKNIYGKDVTLYSSNPTIIEINNNYLINIRWINYTYNENGSKTSIPNQWISLNSRFMVDNHFNKISEEIFLEENYIEQKEYWCIGLEDIRIFNNNNIHYYIASYFDNKRCLTSIASGIMNISDTEYKLHKPIILPTMYDLNNNKIYEKNWTFVNYKNNLCVIYNWFPIQIGEINYTTNKMYITEIKYNIPAYFKDSRGSTCGYIKNNEIWFVLHKAQKSTHDKINVIFNYQHFIAIFDLEMNLIRYSELFKFADFKVEFCIGLIVKDKSIILSYSLLDTTCIISEYEIDYINNNIKWYN